MISCSMENNNMPNPGDTCTVTCKNDYQLMGSGSRTCQIDGSWNGSNATCSRERGEQLLTYIVIHYSYAVRI